MTSEKKLNQKVAVLKRKLTISDKDVKALQKAQLHNLDIVNTKIEQVKQLAAQHSDLMTENKRLHGVIEEAKQIIERARMRSDAAIKEAKVIVDQAGSHIADHRKQIDFLQTSLSKAHTRELAYRGLIADALGRKESNVMSINSERAA